MRESFRLVISYYLHWFSFSPNILQETYSYTHTQISSMCNNYFPLKCETVTRFIWLDKHQMFQTLCSYTISFSIYIHLAHISFYFLIKKHTKDTLSLRNTLPKEKCLTKLVGFQTLLSCRVTAIEVYNLESCCRFKLFILNSQSSNMFPVTTIKRV